MSITDWTFLRSALLALAAWPVCVWLERGLKASARPTPLIWLLVSPFLFPELLLGYLLAPQVMGRPGRAEFACWAVLFLRSVPVGVVALWGMPASDVSPAALHVRRLKQQMLRDRWELARCVWHGPVRRMLPAVGLMFLIAFQEFEAAALLGATSWTDELFTEHAAGLSLSESGKFLMRPLVIQIAVLSLIGWSLWRRSEDDATTSPEDERPVGFVRQCAAELTAMAFFLSGVVGPLLLLSRELAAGWAWLVSQPSAPRQLAEEICTAGLVGLVAGLAAWIAGQRLMQQRMSPIGRWCAASFALPGLCGGLTVSLAMLSISTHWFPSSLAATPLAWVIALVVWLLPRSLLLHFWLLRTDSAAWHLVTLLGDSPRNHQRRAARRWWWRWRIEPQIAAVGLLCYWGYLDLTSASLLRPAGMESVMVRLYNFMHFGHSAAMTMQATIVMLAPIGLWAAMLLAARRWVEKRSRD